MSAPSCLNDPPGSVTSDAICSSAGTGDTSVRSACFVALGSDSFRKEIAQTFTVNRVDYAGRVRLMVRRLGDAEPGTLFNIEVRKVDANGRIPIDGTTTNIALGSLTDTQINALPLLVDTQIEVLLSSGATEPDDTPAASSKKLQLGTTYAMIARIPTPGVLLLGVACHNEDPYPAGQSWTRQPRKTGAGTYSTTQFTKDRRDLAFLFSLGNGLTTNALALACTNNILDGAESGVDCGGSCPNACAVGTTCFNDADCATGSKCSTETPKKCRIQNASGPDMTPATATLAVDNNTGDGISYTQTFTVANGSQPFTFTVGNGTLTNQTATQVTYTSAGAGAATLRVTDAFGFTDESIITINPALSSVADKTDVAASNTAPNVVTVTASGGVPPYKCQIDNAAQTLMPANTCTYTPNAGAPADVFIKISDAFNVVVSKDITIRDPLTLTNNGGTSIDAGATATFTSNGGVAPVVLSILSGPGTLVNGVFTAPTPGTGLTTTVVKATDNIGNTVTSSIVVNPLLRVLSATPTGAGASTITQVAIQFSTFVDPATIETSLSVTGPGGTPAPYTYGYTAATQTAKLTFTSQLAYASAYNVRIAGGAIGAQTLDDGFLVPSSGNASDYVFTFTTRAQGDRDPWHGTFSAGGGWSQGPGVTPAYKAFAVTAEVQPVGSSTGTDGTVTYKLTSGFIGSTRCLATPAPCGCVPANPCQ